MVTRYHSGSSLPLWNSGTTSNAQPGILIQDYSNFSRSFMQRHAVNQALLN